MSSLGSKIVNKCHRQFAEMAVGAIVSVADVERQDVDFEQQNVDEKKGDKADDKKAVRKSTLKRAAPKITIRWTVKGSRQDPSFCLWAPEVGRGPDPVASTVSIMTRLLYYY